MSSPLVVALLPENLQLVIVAGSARMAIAPPFP
jgi:hypothetical protein